MARYIQAFITHSGDYLTINAFHTALQTLIPNHIMRVTLSVSYSDDVTMVLPVSYYI